jgi:hypothetical protein
MKRCEWVSGLDLVDFSVGHEEEVSTKQLSVDPFQGQTSFAPLSDKF